MMMMMMKPHHLISSVVVCLFLVCFCLPSKTDAATNYDGDEVLEVIVDGEEKLRNFSEMVVQFQLSLWKAPAAVTGRSLVHVTSADKEQLKEELEEAGIEFRIVIENLQTQIDRERDSNPVEGVALPWMSTTGGGRRNSQRRKSGRRKRSGSSEEHSIVGKYATYEEISNWLMDLSLTFPNVTRLEVIGKTYEGRDLLLLKIGEERSNVKRPGIWLDAGTHAREWITVSSAIYIISQILTDYYNSGGGGDAAEVNGTESGDDPMSLIASIDWYIVPIVNPDGYAYTYNVNGSRLWRKNRSFYGNLSYSSTYDMICLGTDINRNFNFNWNYYGVLNDSCLETFCGPWPSSENETQAINSYLLSHNSSIHGYVTIHSFGQLFMIRWAYSINAPPTPEHNYTLEVANEAVEAINRTSGFIYRTGTAPEVLYAFSGGSGDWVRAKTPIRHAYDVELRDLGQNGFILPADNIIPIGQEIWAAIKVVATHVLADNPPTTDNITETTTPTDEDFPMMTTSPRNGQMETLPHQTLLLFTVSILVVVLFTRWV